MKPIQQNGYWEIESGHDQAWSSFNIVLILQVPREIELWLQNTHAGHTCIYIYDLEYKMKDSPLWWWPSLFALPLMHWQAMFYSKISCCCNHTKVRWLLSECEKMFSNMYVYNMITKPRWDIEALYVVILVCSLIGGCSAGLDKSQNLSLPFFGQPFSLAVLQYAQSSVSGSVNFRPRLLAGQVQLINLLAQQENLIAPQTLGDGAREGGGVQDQTVQTCMLMISPTLITRLLSGGHTTLSSLTTDPCGLWWKNNNIVCGPPHFHIQTAQQESR